MPESCECEHARRGRNDLQWALPFEAARLIAMGRTFPVSSKIALVVGTILTAANQGGVFLAGTATEATVVRVFVNFLVPYVVSSIAYLAPLRVSRDPGPTRP